MPIGRCAAAEYRQYLIARIFDAVWGFGWYQHAVAFVDDELSVTECHQANAGGDVVDLFGLGMAVELGFLTWWKGGFGEALVDGTVVFWVNQLADGGAVLGGIGGNVEIVGMHG